MHARGGRAGAELGAYGRAPPPAEGHAVALPALLRRVLGEYDAAAAEVEALPVVGDVLKQLEASRGETASGRDAESAAKRLMEEELEREREKRVQQLGTASWVGDGALRIA